MLQHREGVLQRENPRLFSNPARGHAACLLVFLGKEDGDGPSTPVPLLRSSRDNGKARAPQHSNRVYQRSSQTCLTRACVDGDSPRDLAFAFSRRKSSDQPDHLPLTSRATTNQLCSSQPACQLQNWRLLPTGYQKGSAICRGTTPRPSWTVSLDPRNDGGVCRKMICVEQWESVDHDLQPTSKRLVFTRSIAAKSKSGTGTQRETRPPSCFATNTRSCTLQRTLSTPELPLFYTRCAVVTT